MTTIRRLIPLFIIAAVSLSAWLAGVSNYLTLEKLRLYHDVLDQFVSNSLVLAIIAYALLYITAVTLAIPGAVFLTIIGGYLFGQVIGATIIIMAATIGATLFFMIARSATKDILNKRTGQWASKLQRGFQEDAFTYLLTLRLVPACPFIIVNLVAALMQIPISTYFLATLLGIIPGTVVFSSMGVALREAIMRPDFSPSFILEPRILLTLTALGGLSLIPVILKKLGKKISD